MKAAIDKNICFGCGLCAGDCPVVFSINDDNIAQTIASMVPAEHKDACRQAAQNCPVEAITLSE
jgi:ferredoxin